MVYTAIKIAKHIINYCSIKKQPISNLKLQKMLFFVWVDYYKQKNKYLFEENFYAWQFGPVIPEIYYEFCCYAGTPINKKDDVQIDIDEKTISILDAIVDKYIGYTAGQLVQQTHKENSSWYQIYDKGNGLRKTIPFDLIIKTECEV